MGFKEIIKDNVYASKMLNEGKKLMKLQKNIEDMTLEEIVNEINARINKYKNSKEVDYRLIGLILKCSKVNHEIFIIKFLFNVINTIKRSDLKIEYLTEFSKYFDEDILDDFLYYNEYKVGIKGLAENIANRDFKFRIEKKVNNIKYKINELTSELTTSKEAKTEIDSHKGMFLAEIKENPLRLEAKYDEEKRVIREKNEFYKKAVSKLVSMNYDRVDWEKFFHYMDLDIIESVQEELPQNFKGVLIYEYLKYDNLLYTMYGDEQKSEKIIEYILDNIPKEVIINDYLKAGFNNTHFFYEAHFKDVIESISLSDIKRYCNDTGEQIEYYLIQDILKRGLNSAEEYIEIAKYIKQEEIDSFFSSIGYHISIEERLRILNKDDIDDNIKNYIYKSFASYIVIDEEDRKEKNELLKELLPQIKDEEIINMYKIQIAIENNNYNEVFEILKKYNGPIYFFSSDIFLNFSNEQIAELYNLATNPNTRIELLQLSRRKRILNLEDWGNTEITKEENERIPEHILINENNYLEYLKNIKSKREYDLFKAFFHKYENKVSFEQALETYKSMEDGNEVQKIIKEELLTSIICHRISNIEDLRKIIDLKFSNNNIKLALNRIINRKDSLLTIELIKDFLENAEKIDDIIVKGELIDIVIDRFLYKRILFK